MIAEVFPNLALDGIPKDRAARMLLGNDQAKSRGRQAIWPVMQCECLALNHASGSKDFRILCCCQKPVLSAEAKVLRWRPLLFAAVCFICLRCVCVRRPNLRLRDDDVPWHDGRGSHCDHRACACERESRGYACAARRKVDKYVSWPGSLQKSAQLQPVRKLCVKYFFFLASMA